MVRVKRALVIDDDAAIRILVTRILARYEFSVDSAADGAEGIELMRDNEYDVIVLDLMMPRIDGFGVVKFLSEHDPEKLQRVIVMTAYGSGVQQKVCPPVGRFIHKPFEISTLLAYAAQCGAAGGENREGSSGC